MKLSIQSIVNLTLSIKHQLENQEKSFRTELKECSVETLVDSGWLEVYINGVIVYEILEYEISNNSIGLIIEDVELFLNNKLRRCNY